MCQHICPGFYELNYIQQEMSLLGLAAVCIAPAILVLCVASFYNASKGRVGGNHLVDIKAMLKIDEETFAETVEISVLHSLKNVTHILLTWRNHQFSVLGPFENSKVMNSLPVLSLTLGSVLTFFVLS